jgi:hypothetical protein
MRLTEEYKRIDHDTLSIALTIEDPKAYTAVWVGKPHIFTLKPDWNLQEYYCINEDMASYDKDIRFRSVEPEKKPSKSGTNGTPKK